MTLHSPDMSETLIQIRSMIISRGVSVEIGNRQEYAHGAFSLEFIVNRIRSIEVSWSHVEQRVFLRIPGKVVRRGRFRHVSLCNNSKNYFRRISSWIDKHFGWSECLRESEDDDSGEVLATRKVKRKQAVVCDCGAKFVFAGSVDDAYKCPSCGLFCAAQASGMKMMDVNDALSFRAAITALWWRHKRISDSLELAMTAIPVTDKPMISVASAKAILNNIGSRDTETEEAACESYMQRFFS
jgi:hypothetical protein